VRKETLVLALVFLGASSASVVACSSSSSSGGGSPDASKPADAGVTNCVPTTMKNNAEGVGGYCTADGGQCVVGDGATTTICTANFSAEVPPGASFCTNECQPDAGSVACGVGGPPCVTVKGTGVSVCLPTSCMAFLQAFEGDAGKD
jgi:hypothetical protein